MASVEATPRAIAPGGTAYITVNATDADGDALTYSYTVAPDGLGTLTGTGATVSFAAAATAPEGSTATVTVTVTDSHGNTTTGSVAITITGSASFVIPAGPYVGAETCGHCHSRTFTSWSGSPHQGATYAGARNGNVDPSRTWTNVECEDCHGPGHDHATDPQRRSTATSPWDPINLPDHLACAVCHSAGTGAPPAYTEWQDTAHAHALTDLVASGHASDSCLNCHSYERINDWQDVNLPVAGASLTHAPLQAENGLTCLVCHRGHSLSTRDPNTADNTYGKADLCMDCHTGGTMSLAGTPHHDTAEVILGKSGWAADGSPIPDDEPSHRGIEDLCVGCHMYPAPDGSTTGHKFLPDLDSRNNTCNASCHARWNVRQKVDNRHSEIDARIAALQAYYTAGGATYINRAALTTDQQTLYDKAKFNVNAVVADGSRGVHAPDFTDDLLDASQAIFTALGP
jgi:hypothetical protein